MLTRRQVVAVALIAYALGAVFAALAFAGSFTVTTTAEQDAALAEMAKRQVMLGPRPASAVVPVTAMTPQMAVQQIVDRSLAGQVSQIKRAAACTKVTDAATKAAFGCPK